MSLTARNISKAVLARSAGAISRNARFDNCVFVLSHMRSVSTALSNVLCAHPDICGYGETHVEYANVGTPGGLWLNLAVRHGQGWPQGRLFDKILHNDLDDQLDDAFFTAKVIFLLRAPAPAVASIQSLARRNGMVQWDNINDAAEYYLQRVTRMTEVWLRFPTVNRIGHLTEDIQSKPDNCLLQISEFLGLRPVLKNHYQAANRVLRHGVGDPDIAMGKTRIEPVPTAVDLGPVVGADQAKSDACLNAYSALAELFKADADQGRFRV